MAGTDEPEVKEVDRVEITPAGDDEELVEPEETEADSSQQETDGTPEADAEGDKPDALVTTPTAPVAPAQADDAGIDDDDLAVVEGETPRERALRLDNTRLKAKLRQERGEDLLGGTTHSPTRKAELAPEESAIIGKYKPEEIGALREVIPVLAKEMGFVRKDELEGSTYAERSQEHLDSFLGKHPEYLPENDKDGSLWNAFKAEFQIYQKPSNPKDYTKLFERVHREVFGIKPKGALSTVNAQREKVNVSSHAGSSSAPATPRAKPATSNPSGLRLDMLKGFTDEEKTELFSEDE